MRALPLAIFAEMIDNAAHGHKLREDSHISLLQGVLSLLMPSSALAPRKVDRARDEAGGTSPAILEKCFLPNAANTIVAEDNAKVSLLLEALMRVVILVGIESFSPGLEGAVRKGVEARLDKVKRKKTRGRPTGAGRHEDDPDAEARAVLEMSGERLLLLAKVAGIAIEAGHQSDADSGESSEDEDDSSEDGSDVEMGSGDDDEVQKEEQGQSAKKCNFAVFVCFLFSWSTIAGHFPTNSSYRFQGDEPEKGRHQRTPDVAR